MEVAFFFAREGTSYLERARQANHLDERSNATSISMSSDDAELRRKLLHLQRRLIVEKAKRCKGKEVITPDELLRPHLKDRAGTVLEAARQQYPQLHGRIVGELAGLVKRGELKEITGPWLCSVFEYLGYPLRLRTQIRVVSDGKAISMAEKLKG